MKIIILMALFSFNNVMASTGGGNGGHPAELRVKVVLNELQEFFQAEENQLDFPEVDFDEFHKIIPMISPFATDNELKDKFGEKRCLLNEDFILSISLECWDKYLKDKEQDHFAMIFHEVLGFMGVETAGKYIPSSYPVSSRLEKYVQRISRFGLVSRNYKIDNFVISCFSINKFNNEQLIAFFDLTKPKPEVTISLGVEKTRNRILHNMGDWWMNLGEESKGESQVDVSKFKRETAVVELSMNTDVSTYISIYSSTYTKDRYFSDSQVIYLDFNNTDAFRFDLMAMIKGRLSEGKGIFSERLVKYKEYYNISFKEIKTNYDCAARSLSRHTSIEKYKELMSTTGWVYNDHRPMTPNELNSFRNYFLSKTR